MIASVARLPERLCDPVAVADAAQVVFQPIVSMTSLRAHGFEALTRLPGDCRFENVHALLDAAATQGRLRRVERTLLTRSIDRFARFEGAASTRLFCNIDNRVFEDAAIDPDQIIGLVKAAGLEPGNLCIELSERKPLRSADALRRLVDTFMRSNVRIAIDDFGAGYSGLDMLLRVSPHYVKVDRAFIDGMAQNPRKQAIVGKIVGLVHSLGFLIVAEGVETEADFRAARDAGCDFAQGYLVSRPTGLIAELRGDYSATVGCAAPNTAIPRAVAELLDPREPLRINEPLSNAVQRFKAAGSPTLLPVIDDHDYVHGAIYEADLSNYLFGDFGAALLANRGLDQSLGRMVRRCPISEATVPPEALVESYVVASGNAGIVLTLDGRYVGMLGNSAILRLAAARDVALARDQNPLTGLPGNNRINKHLTDLLSSAATSTLVFFDFDNFKAFNDAYGFATGDRALLMFAELLTKRKIAHDLFIGHVGGDDFFMSIPCEADDAAVLVREICAKFSHDVESLYVAADREGGGFWARDRHGERRLFPLLRTSAAIAPLPAARAHLSINGVIAALSEAKAAAKKSAEGLAWAGLPATGVAAQLARLLQR